MAEKQGKLRTEARAARMSKALRENLRKRKAASRKQSGSQANDRGRAATES